ncbi:hypothetical protein CJD36_010960 [Flavipsychrobacter stenotrophus]|uniref:Uncharacterized protein n=1 Tax=Flavipsychrobacter stenotrophus TaxID=2077091 RepID=A0A2S7SUU0_9BACT|nr:hypothetical protein [Flavipsychrobacter stenotrophus]PQJ10488.1 hypothetical protein CJD36_010960 [Flavipsychrobacter stenotrophus]
MKDKSYDIVPFQSVGDILFSDSREQIRNKIGGRIMDGEYVFEDIVELYDYFPDSDIKVLYDRNGHLGAVEFYQGKVLFKDNDIFHSSFKALKELFEKIDPKLETDMGFKSYEHGIGICGDEEDDTITSVIIFEKDYYS